MKSQKALQAFVFAGPFYAQARAEEVCRRCGARAARRVGGKELPPIRFGCKISIEVMEKRLYDGSTNSYGGKDMLKLYFWEQMVNLIHAPFHIYNEEGNLIQRIGGSQEATNFLDENADLKEKAFARRQEHYPVIFTDGLLIMAVFGEDTLEGRKLLAGPVSVEPLGRGALAKMRRRYQVDKSKGYVLPYCELEPFISGILLLHGQLTGEELSIAQFWKINRQHYPAITNIHNRVSYDIFIQHENVGTHNPYEEEVRELHSIEKGDVEALAKSISETYEGDFGVLAKDPLRSHKNLVVGNITMASRAAIRGGVCAEAAFSVADSLIQQLEEIDNIPEVSAFKQEAQYIYANMVADLRLEEQEKKQAGKNPLIGQVKDYIYTHLHEPIQVADIAEHIEVNADYLSHLFKTLEEITITQYIQREKVKRGENLLKYSDYRIKDIAFYLGFSTQSHFARVFYQIEGMSPNEYRKQFGNRKRWKIK